MAKLRRTWTIKRLISALNDSLASPKASEPKVSVVSVDHTEYRQRHNQEDGKAAVSLPVEVLGETYYAFKDFGIEFHWQLTGGLYQRAWGVMPSTFVTSVNELYFESNLEVVDQNNQSLSDNEIAEIIRPIFLNTYHEWKSEAMMVPIGMQPTHFSENTLWGVRDLKAVSNISIRNFSSLVRHEGLHFQGSYILEDKLKLESGHMRGYAYYRVGSELTDMFIYLNWMMRFGNAEPGQIRPEIALVEGENIPGLVLSGAVLTDSNDNYISSAQELVHLFRFISDRKEWLDACVELFMNWIGEQQPKKNSDKSIQSNRVQLSLFEDMSKDAKSYTVPCDNEPDLNFDGKLVARVIETSSKKGCARILDLYQTKEGRWVAAKQSLSENEENENYREAKVFNTQNEVVSFFGMDQLAKNLYTRAKINFSRFV